MLQTLSDSAVVLGRVVTIFPLLLAFALFMGKRAIGEIPVFDFLVIITIANVVGADIADPEIQHIPTAFAIVTTALLQRLVAKLKLSNRKIGRLLTFEPTIIVYNGKILRENLRKNRYSIDNLLQMLREKNVFDVNDVHLAVLEASGGLSVLKKGDKETVTREDLQIKNKKMDIAYPVIVEGNIYSSVLKDLSLTESWLFEQLHARGIRDLQKIFYASINYEHDLHISLKDENPNQAPIIYH
ncbi:DUF421 domain-containing protein [Bacillus shivajii]|uniref:DUF421 domain-containing protein n=1 Tax=Bacillus shivajii TaxID=1983719 RepID=UPI001CFC1795|nr:DUF421 domain-containing protein [Bacillus shivajii]UCZ53152.1 DUF421 domain-containing protein [Bacillus shivajii]